MKKALLFAIGGFIAGFLLSTWYGKTMSVEKTAVTLPSPTSTPRIGNPPDKNTVYIRNATGNRSYISTMDINNDGIDEIIYQPKSMSFNNHLYILKEESGSFSPFCSNCVFENAISPEKDSNNRVVVKTKDGIYFFNGKTFINKD